MDQASMKIYTKTGDRGETGLLGAARVSKSNGRIEALGSVDELNASLGVLRSHATGPATGLDAGLATGLDAGLATGLDAGLATGLDAGLATAIAAEPSMDTALLGVQKVLFEIGAAVADVRSPPQALQVSTATQALEEQMDRWSQEIPPLTSFVLPAGTTLASLTHWSRCVCRRAERRVVELIEWETHGTGDRVPAGIGDAGTGDAGTGDAGTGERPPSQDLLLSNLSASQIYLNRLSDWLFVLARLWNHRMGVRDEPWP